MKNTAFNIAALAIMTFLTSCEDTTTIPVSKDLAVAEIVTDVLVTVPEKAIQYLYVTAPSGLSLRAHNNLNSDKLAVMPYGTKVEIVTAETNNTMKVQGVAGGMHEVSYNNKKGYAFNGYLSELFPPERGANAKMYIEDLQNTHPTATITEVTGGTASNPTNSQTLLLPTSKWHEAFLIAQKLYEIPRSFVVPSPKGKDKMVLKNPKQVSKNWISEIHVERKENTLQKIVYVNASESYGRTVIITKVGDMIQIEEVSEVK